MDWDALYCSVDDFCQQFEPLWQRQQLDSGQRKRHRSRSLSNSEIMTILIAFHSSHHRNFKHFYLMLARQHSAEFPRLVSYNRFVEWMPSVLGLLCAYLHHRFGACTGIAFVDSTSIVACAISGFPGIKRSNRLPVVGKQPWDGSTARNSTWSSTRWANCWPVA